MSDRYKNMAWVLRPNLDGKLGWEGCKLAVLMDIRDELQTLNRVFQCTHFLTLPHTLKEIERLTLEVKRNTTKPKRRKKKA